MLKKVICLALLLLVLGYLSLGCSTPGQESGGEDIQKPKEEEIALEQPITLRFAFFAPAHTFPGVHMEEWAKRIEERTQGRVNVETFPGGTLLQALNMYDGVSEGVADIGLSCPSYEPGRFPLFAIMDLPLGFIDQKASTMVFLDLLEEFQPKELEEYKVITAFTTEQNYIQSKTKVDSLASIRGLELRTAGTGMPLLGALSASGVGMPMSEVPESLNTGIIDGYVASREVLLDFKFAELINYITDYPTFQVTFLALMSKDVWDSIPSDLQEIIDEVGREVSEWTAFEFYDNHVQNALDFALEQGVEVVSLSPEEKARFDELLEPLVNKYVNEVEEMGLPGKEFFERLNQLKEKYS